MAILKSHVIGKLEVAGAEEHVSCNHEKAKLSGTCDWQSCLGWLRGICE